VYHETSPSEHSRKHMQTITWPSIVSQLTIVELAGPVLVETAYYTGLMNTGNNIPSLEEFDHTNDTDNNVDSGDISEDGDEEDDGEFEKLSKEEHSHLLDDISAVRETVSKILSTIYLCLSDIVDMFLHSFDNSHLQSFTQLLLRFQLGDDYALFMNLN